MASQTVTPITQLKNFPGRFGLVGTSRVMRELFEQIEIVAAAQGPVLILGESGTGKELVAKAIHQHSKRAGKSFQVVNCAGIPQELLETEFFGYVKGAFTGAGQSQTGILQQADEGSLFLDEIGDMPVSLQAKLLRAIQDGSVRPVGHKREDRVDVRIIAATHADLKKKVAHGEFRQDLFYRLETFMIHVPPLRERGHDKMLLAEQFLTQQCGKQGKQISGFSEAATQLLESYTFPGNVRELQNLVERAVAFCETDTIDIGQLSPRLAEVVAEPSGRELLLAGSGLPSLSELQNRYLQLVLAETGNNKQQAAQILGIGRRTLYRWLKQVETGCYHSPSD